MQIDDFEIDFASVPLKIPVITKDTVCHNINTGEVVPIKNWYYTVIFYVSDEFRSRVFLYEKAITAVADGIKHGFITKSNIPVPDVNNGFKFFNNDTSYTNYIKEVLLSKKDDITRSDNCYDYLDIKDVEMKLVHTIKSDVYFDEVICFYSKDFELMQIEVKSRGSLLVEQEFEV